jgi:hypothetical protein
LKIERGSLIWRNLIDIHSRLKTERYKGDEI